MTKAYPYHETTPPCSRQGCCMPANPHNADGLCGACERADIERQRKQWAADGRTRLGVTLWQMSEWLDEDGDE